ncbi:uncharacterized protein LOC113069810 isoform X3 [Carassius auratus]|nr:uncharacterized protein LOC113069810 isoform X3 [Carassius auratus]XP_026098689.1 uncharacterized protein LOC113069810 isoform X3 [Carassius auratus]
MHQHLKKIHPGAAGDDGAPFPLTRPDICGKWLAAIKRRNFKPTKYSNICSQHFTRDCFKRECNNRVLKDNAVPSLFTSSRLQTEAASLEETFSPDLEFPLSLPMSDAEETPAEHPSEAQPGPDHSSTFISCDHNYTVEDTVQQKIIAGNMVQSCSAYGCKNRYHKDKNISFHKFPLTRPDICGKWLAAIKRRNFKPTKYSNICSQHFTRDCFKRECNNRVLKDNAVPSLFTSSRLQTEAASLEETFSPDLEFPLSLPMSDAEETPAEHPSEAQPGPDHSSTFISCDHNYTVEDTVQQKIIAGNMVQSCSAYGCKNRYHKDKNISFHKFPLTRPDICGKWLAAIKRRNFKPTKYSNICSQHFTRDCFKRECNNRVLKDNAVPSLFTSSRLQTEAASLEETFSPDLEFPLSLPMSDAEETPAEHPSEAQPGPDHSSTFISCDHNYTVEDTVQQKRRIGTLQEQLEKLRKRLKTVQQKCRRQERQLERFRAMRQVQKPSKDTPLREGYVILPKEIYDVLIGIETIGAL